MDCENTLVIFSSESSLDEILKKSHPFKDASSSKKPATINISNLTNLTGIQYDKIITIEQCFTDEQLKQIFQMLKPNSILVIVKTNQIKNMSFNLKANGFVLEPPSDLDFIVARRPEYEIGSAVKISTNDKKKIWSLAANDITDGDLINDDDLLDEKDKMKPKAEDLKVCATTKQRKACANCSCGLKEELEKEEMDKIKANTQNAKSSCGNCYLGDAFRCESCPYRGMPAFKPGEKVKIDTSDDL